MCAYDLTYASSRALATDQLVSIQLFLFCCRPPPSSSQSPPIIIIVIIIIIIIIIITKFIADIPVYCVLYTLYCVVVVAHST